MLVAERRFSQKAEATFTGCAKSAGLCCCVLVPELNLPEDKNLTGNFWALH